MDNDLKIVTGLFVASVAVPAVLSFVSERKRKKNLEDLNQVAVDFQARIQERKANFDAERAWRNTEGGIPNITVTEIHREQ